MFPRKLFLRPVLWSCLRKLWTLDLVHHHLEWAWTAPLPSTPSPNTIKLTIITYLDDVVEGDIKLQIVDSNSQVVAAYQLTRISNKEFIGTMPTLSYQSVKPTIGNSVTYKVGLSMIIKNFATLVAGMIYLPDVFATIEWPELAVMVSDTLSNSS